MWAKESMGEGGGFENDTTLNESIAPTKESARTIQSLVPVCVRQLINHTGEEFTLFGFHTQMVSLVGILREYEVQSTKATYEIEDHTGRISAIVWVADDGTTPYLPIVKEGCYVRVYGSIRKQEGRTILMVLSMHPIDDPDVITTHLLKVIEARLEAENFKNNKGNTMRTFGNDVSNMEMGSFSDNQNCFLDQSGLNALQQKVYNILKSSTSATGISTGGVCQQFPSNQHKDVKAALDFLIAEGHAYSTIDSNHFKVTEAM